MITGIVSEDREAAVQLKIMGKTSRTAEVEAVIDTGLTECLTLPRRLVTELGLPAFDSASVVLADGSEVSLQQYECTLLWGDQTLTIVALCAEGVPLIGMELLWDHLLTLQATTDGPVNITPIP